MTLSYLEQKRLEYNDIGPAPECTQLDSYENRIYGLKQAIKFVLNPINGRKQSIIDAVQKDIFRALEKELIGIQQDVEYIRLREEKNQSLIEKEQITGEESTLQLHEKNIERIKKVIESLPLDTPIASDNPPIAGINVADFDLFYKDRYFKAITNTGNVLYPGSNKSPKKIMVSNIEELQKKNFLRSIMVHQSGNPYFFNQYKGCLERGEIISTIYVGAPLNHYLALVFDCRNEAVSESHGSIQMVPVSVLKSDKIVPDIKIEHTAYIKHKRNEFNIKI